MSKNFKNSLVSIIAIVILIAMSLTGIVIGQTSGIADAKSLDAEATKLSITRSVDAMTVGQISQFVAEVTFDDETTSNDVVWSSDDDSIATVSADGAVKALKVGTVNITAAYGENLTASVNIQVYEASNNIVGIHLSKYMLVLRVDEDYTFEVSSPYDVLEWTSSDGDVVDVNEQGELYALDEGIATITASAINPETQEVASSASCLVSVIPADSATLDQPSITYTSVNATAETLTVSLPDGVEAASYEWYSLYSDVASVDPDDTDESKCVIQPWRFGSTIITVVVTGTNNVRYGAYCDVLVTSDTFFITGEQNGWIGLPNDAWNLTQTSKGVYTIKTNLWAYSGFQIIHNNIDTDWTTKLTPWWYNGNQSNDNYVANTPDMFEVTAYGIYDVTLDLTQGIAKVSIVLDKAYTTSVGLDFTPTSKSYLQGLDSEVTIAITPLPDGSIYNPADISAVVGAIEGEVATVTADVNVDAMTVTVKLTSDYEGKDYVIVPITVHMGEAYAEFDVVIVPAGEDYVPVSELAFVYTSEEPDRYVIDVNNGKDAAWELPFQMTINEDASVKQINFTTDSANLYVDVDENGAMKFVAGGLGTFTVTATSVGTTEDGQHKTAKATVYVYSGGLYMIGMINGEIPGEWVALEPEITSLEGTPFAPYELEPVEGAEGKYSITTTLNQFDLFSVAFLGMTGNWNGAITNVYLDEAASSMDSISKNGVNVQIDKRGIYTITVDLNKATPVLTVEYISAADEGVEVGDLYVYILRAGGAWDGNATPEDNIVATFPGYVDMTNPTSETTLSVVLNLDNFNGAWPTLQFVTATGINEGGDFENATWYDQFANVPITGDAFAATGAENQFTNDGAGCQMWLVGTAPYDYVRFTLTFDIEGNITGIEMNFVPVEA